VGLQMRERIVFSRWYLVFSEERKKKVARCKMRVASAGSRPVCRSTGLPVENKYKYKRKVEKVGQAPF
jgi:hypothetical protein